MPKILIGIAGGIAAYKSATLVSRLAQNDFDVQVAMSGAALKFVGAATFAALSGKPVCTEMFDARFPLGPHIELARWADLVCFAPATAHLIGEAANGMTSGVLSATYSCTTSEQTVMMAPAMNVEMWNRPSVQRNVSQLVEDGVEMIGPDEGWLSCRTTGSGRMSEPEAIFAAIQKKF